MSDAELNVVIAILGTVLTVAALLYTGVKIWEIPQNIKNNKMLMEGYREYYQSLPADSRKRRNIDSIEDFLDKVERGASVFGTNNPIYRAIDAIEDITDDITGTVDEEPDGPSVGGNDSSGAQPAEDIRG